VALILGILLCVSLFLFNHNVMVPLLAKNVLRVGAHGFGLLMSSMGTGAVVGALAVALWGRHPPLRLVLAAAVASACLTACLGGVQSFGWACAVLAMLGFSQIIFMASCNTTLQSESPDHLRGRVMSIYAFVFAGITPLGSFLMGSLAQGFGVRATYLSCGACGLAGILALAWVWAKRLRQPAAEPGRVETPVGAVS
jgi:MFS family permease